ncbi:hypothetical protein [Klebsiella pneumoniae]|uniref:hypothetical protein n=1 Tax=Klebsiella pneumoniae TaxID=573 RepID=UPI0027311DD0|nr:hypothetical protein [Klebsiella pneumoniae]MDP0875011.1 hypothetical protein [Klebsiella pneumoniae]
MTHLKLTPAEEKRLADAFVAQALAMGLKGNRTLPKAVKQQVRERVLRSIQDECEARQAQEIRREKYEAAETTFTWQPRRRR